MLARPTLSRSSRAIGLDAIATSIDRHGLSSVGHEVIDRIATSAREAGVDRTLIEVLVDPAAPEVARNRAFGRIHGLLGAEPARSDLPVAA